MIRGTTPTFTLTIKDSSVDLSLANSVYVTVSQKATTVTKTGTDVTVDGQTVSCWLTQAEALSFSNGTAEIQVNWTYIDDNDGATRRAATRVKSINIDKQLLGRVIE